MPQHLLAEVAREHPRLMLVREQLATAGAGTAAAAQTMRLRLRRSSFASVLKGLGRCSPRLHHEVFYKDFRNRREVAGYVGLARVPAQRWIDASRGSASRNPRARLKAIELAWCGASSARQRAHQWFRARTVNVS